MAFLKDQLAPFLQRVRRPLSESLGLQDVCEVELGHLGPCMGSFFLGPQPSLDTEVPHNSYYTLVFQPQLFRNFLNGRLSLQKVYLICVAASIPHLYCCQLALVFDPRLAEVLLELLLVESGDLRVEPDSLRILFVLALELLVDRLQLFLFFLVPLDWLRDTVLELFQLLNFLDGILALWQERRFEKIRKKHSRLV